MDHPETPSPGGARLRELRRRLGITQLWVELEAELGTGYLQRVESGRVHQPGRDTLERILSAMDARFTERKEVLELFGYTVSVTPPDDDEVAWACDLARPELDEFPFPAYALECTNRLIAWNPVFPFLLGESSTEDDVMRLAHGSFLEAWFDPESPLYGLVDEPDRFLPALIRAFRHEMRQFQNEEWYEAVLAGPRRFELFRHYWAIVEAEPEHAAAARALVPVRLNVPGFGLMQFRLSVERFTRDHRFRIVYYFPSDSVTMDICARWNSRIAPAS